MEGEIIYKKLCAEMARRGGRYPGMDIPEFYDLARELFTPEEAAVAAGMGTRPKTAQAMATELGKGEQEMQAILETMADKGLCRSFEMDGNRYYAGSPFVPGIFEFQFMRGTRTDRDRRLARVIHAYKEAFDKARGPVPITFPPFRVIPVGENIQSDARVRTYNQVSSYIDQHELIAVSTCFCRHEAKLLDEKDDCGMPDDVCMQFGMAAKYVIERGMGRKVTREEARNTLKRAAEAGLVHAGVNKQDLDFLCNCCSCHCMILKTALSQPKPGRVLFSGFQPRIDPEICTACQTCVDRCPAKAALFIEDTIKIDADRCFGCGVCAVGCPAEAIDMVDKPGSPEPPLNAKSLREALGPVA